MKTQNKKSIRKNVPEKYFEFLNTIYKYKMAKIKFDMQEYLITKKISRGVPGALCELKILQKTGHNQWMWIADKPNMQMALDAIEVLRLKSEKYNASLKVEAPKIEQTPVKKHVSILPKKRAIKKETPVEKTGFKISLFWGLINLQKN